MKQSLGRGLEQKLRNIPSTSTEDGDNGYTYPVLMDTEAELFYFYGIMSYPTTFMIDRDGNIFGYVTGQLNYEIMEDIVRQTMEGKR